MSYFIDLPTNKCVAFLDNLSGVPKLITILARYIKIRFREIKREWLILLITRGKLNIRQGSVPIIQETTENYVDNPKH